MKSTVKLTIPWPVEAPRAHSRMPSIHELTVDFLENWLQSFVTTSTIGEIAIARSKTREEIIEDIRSVFRNR